MRLKNSPKWALKTEYSSWRSAKNRVTNPNYKSSEFYLGRGITMCDSWLNNFYAFFKDMGPRPRGTSLDRIDNDGNYEPGNCRWATSKQQLSNTSRTAKIEYNGERLTIAEFARRLKMPLHRVRYLYHKGLSVEEIESKLK